MLTIRLESILFHHTNQRIHEKSVCDYYTIIIGFHELLNEALCSINGLLPGFLLPLRCPSVTDSDVKINLSILLFLSEIKKTARCVHKQAELIIGLRSSYCSYSTRELHAQVGTFL